MKAAQDMGSLAETRELLAVIRGVVGAKSLSTLMKSDIGLYRFV